MKPLIMEVRVGRKGSIFATATPGHRLMIERDADGRVTADAPDIVYTMIDAPGSFTFVATEQPAEKTETEPEDDEGEHETPAEGTASAEPPALELKTPAEDAKPAEEPAVAGTPPRVKGDMIVPPMPAPPHSSTAHSGVPGMPRPERLRAPLGTPDSTGTPDDDTVTPDGTDVPPDETTAAEEPPKKEFHFTK